MSTLTPYTSYFKRWKQEAGKRPTVQQIRQVEQNHLARPGTKNALALAMTLRPQGATQSQISSVLGQPHRNKIKDVVARKQARLVAMPKVRGVTVYRIALNMR